MERKTLAEIHFSIHSLIVDDDFRLKFLDWVAGSKDYNRIDWLASPISKTEFPEEISWHDVIDYTFKIPFANRSLSATNGDMLKIQRMETAEHLFDKFVHEGLDEQTARKVEYVWNDTFNSFPAVDYKNFDYTLQGFSGTLDGKKFTLHEQQKKGIAFLCTKQNGLLAYDVGVGKTATGLAAVVYQMQHGKCRRPLIVVPKAVYPKWIHDTKELFPDITINELENLNKETIDTLRMNSVFEEANDGFLLPANTISICTAEALEKIYYTPGFIENTLCRTIHNQISQAALAKELLPSPKQSTEEYIIFDTLGADLILVDEAHRYKKPHPQSYRHHIGVHKTWLWQPFCTRNQNAGPYRLYSHTQQRKQRLFPHGNTLYKLAHGNIFNAVVRRRLRVYLNVQNRKRLSERICRNKNRMDLKQQKPARAKNSNEKLPLPVRPAANHPELYRQSRRRRSKHQTPGQRNPRNKNRNDSPSAKNLPKRN